MNARLISIGLVEIVAFLITFAFLVPHYGALGAAFSTLTAFVSSSLLSLVWSERRTAKYVGVSAMAISVGIAASFIIDLTTNIHPIATILISMVISLSVVIILKNISTNEINQIAKGIIAKIG
jgi:flagellar biosynthesis protein FliR